MASQRLKRFKNFYPVKGDFKDIDIILKNKKINKVNGILFDLGISSLHLDKEERGFSFLKEAFLDMRMDKTKRLKAYDVVNKYNRDKLERIIKEYGEEKEYKKIARRIIENRPIKTTTELAEIIRGVKRYKRGKIDPATKTFQAIRIEVNDELNSLKVALEKSIELLEKGGRVVTIAYHSLEDRIIKNIFFRESKDCICEDKRYPCRCGHKRKIKFIVKKPIKPEIDEIRKNKRARSARLRVIEKL